jgi:hypothetical protein
MARLIKGPREMTVCIAALCKDEDGVPAIVLCSDNLGSTPLGNKSLIIKTRPLAGTWRIQTAGAEGDLNLLEKLLTRSFRELHGSNEGMDETNVLPAIRAAHQELKRQKASEYTQLKWGMTYENFLSSKNKFPDDEYRADVFAIGQIPLRTECLISGFDRYGLPMLVQADGAQGSSIQEDFAVAGEGSLLARSALLARGHHDGASLNETLYYVYEAKRCAERVRSVGDLTQLMVVWPYKNRRVLTAGFHYLAEKFAKYGPQEIPPGGIDLPVEVLQPLLPNLAITSDEGE